MAYLVTMSLDDFHGLPQRVVPRTVRMQDPSLTSQKAIDWILMGYYQQLIHKNEPLTNLLNQQTAQLEDDAFVRETTKGQRLLIFLEALDGQTCNGGVSQFIWNCPEMVLPTLDALKTLDYQELILSYQKVVEHLESNAEQWSRLRSAEHTTKDEMWEDFKSSQRLIGDEFDAAYFDLLGKNARKAAVDYVNANTSEFITEKG